MIPPSAPDLAPEPEGVCSLPRRRPASGAAPAQPSPSSHRPDLIARLKAGIAALEGTAPRFDAALPAGGPSPWRLGLDGLDARLPAAGLAADGVHAVLPGSPSDIAAAMGFCAALAVRRLVTLDPQDTRPVLWVRQTLMTREAGRLHGHGLAALGLPHGRLVTVSLRKPAAVLWTIEEALKSKALSAVVADGDPAKLDLATVRRLVLAAAAGATPAVLCLPKPCAEAVAGAHTRWQVAAAASQAPAFDPEAPGLPAWTIELQHCRSGRPGSASAEWHHASHRFSVAAALPGGAPGARTAQDERPAAAGSRAVRAG
jgi:protein ImuA